MSGKVSVGTKINVGDVVSKATNLLRENPSIIAIQAIPAIPSIVGDLARSTVFSPIVIITTILYAVLSIIASGAYAPVVKEALAGQTLTIGQAFGLAYHRFWSLLGAGILIVIIVFLGAIAFVVPGLIFATWYAYSTPSIMLENKGAWEGMSASKAFGRDKKWSTFLIFLVFFLVYLIIGILGILLSLGGGGRIISSLLDIPLGAWTSVVISYIYITHALTPSVSAGQEPGWPAPPSAAPGPSMAPPGAQFANRFCPSCGAPLKPDSKFCSSCGRPV